MAHFLNRLRQPALVSMVVFDPAYLLAGADHKPVGDGGVNLVLHQSTVGKHLDRMVRIDSTMGRWPFDFLNSTGTTPFVVRIRQSGIPEIPHLWERSTSP